MIELANAIECAVLALHTLTPSARPVSVLLLGPPYSREDK